MISERKQGPLGRSLVKGVLPGPYEPKRAAAKSSLILGRLWNVGFWVQMNQLLGASLLTGQ